MPRSPEEFYEEHCQDAQRFEETKTTYDKHLEEAREAADLTKHPELWDKASAEYQTETKEKIVEAVRVGDYSRAEELIRELRSHLDTIGKYQGVKRGEGTPATETITKKPDKAALFETFYNDHNRPQLSPREEKIGAMRYVSKMPLEEIAEHFAVNKERIRQILTKIDRKIVRYYSEKEIKKKIKEWDRESEKETPLEELPISSRLYNALRNVGIKNVGHLSSLTEAEFLHLKKIGRKALFELHELGIHLKEETSR